MFKYKTPAYRKINQYISILIFFSFVINAQHDDYQLLEVNTGQFDFGKKATKKEIAGWHIEVSHNHNLPQGEGTAADGEDLYDEHCASCHGSFGEGEGRHPVLAGGENTLTNRAKPERTVGSYWPYASTLLDYIHRTMPFHAPQSLSWDETWSLSAYVLYLNDIITDEDFVFNSESYRTIKMPNEDGFIQDQRPDTNNTRCMKNCKNLKDINIKPALLGYESGAQDIKIPSTDGKVQSEGQLIYQQSCHVCHASGITGAPKFDDREYWGQRKKIDKNVLYQHAINGYQGDLGVMPAKGGYANLTDQQIKLVVDYMIKGS